MRRSLWLTLAAVLIGTGLYLYRQRTPVAPPGQPALVTLTPESLDAVRQAFNDSADRTRLLLLLSPT